MAEHSIDVLLINENPVDNRLLRGMVSTCDKHRFTVQCADRRRLPVLIDQPHVAS